MITEIALLNIKQGESKTFESAFQKAQLIISSMNGYISHELLVCIEQSDKYLLTVNWKTLEDHVTGFRNSDEYKAWKQLLHHFYEPFPTVEHYQKIF